MNGELDPKARELFAQASEAEEELARARKQAVRERLFVATGVAIATKAASASAASASAIRLVGGLKLYASIAVVAVGLVWGVEILPRSAPHAEQAQNAEKKPAAEATHDRSVSTVAATHEAEPTEARPLPTRVHRAARSSEQKHAAASATRVLPQIDEAAPSVASEQAPPETAAPRADAAHEPSLHADLRRLLDAHRALSEHRPERALSLLGEVTHPGLQAERTALRALALCASNRRAEAQIERTLLSRTAPDSPLWPRVNRSCGW